MIALSFEEELLLFSALNVTKTLYSKFMLTAALYAAAEVLRCLPTRLKFMTHHAALPLTPGSE